MSTRIDWSPIRILSACWLVGLAAPGCGGGTDGPVDAALDVDVSLDGGADSALPDVRPDLGEMGTLAGSYALTYYWVSHENEFAEPDSTPLSGTDCTAIADVPADFVQAVTDEGFGLLADDRLVRYRGSCGCPGGQCFELIDPAESRWGTAAGGAQRDPFRTIALGVRPRGLAANTPVFIPAFYGVEMPGNPRWVHDGCFFTADRDSSVDRSQIDVFAGRADWWRDLFERMPLAEVPVYNASPYCP